MLMEDHKNSEEEADKVVDHEVMLPGFRFHPTDEELVGFYLKMKIQHRVLPIELIKQVDIYKYNPWDLPNLAPSDEKEWYFYCPRDRKYKNSTRPNRVTGAGFWKATGTDRPIYSSNGAKCIGLKKSLVFYRGRAAKGIKTDWMMHEFRLPSIIDTQHMNRKIQDKNIPPNEAWAICRIFKKTNSMTQRALSNSWLSNSLTEDNHKVSLPCSNPFISNITENISSMTDSYLYNLIKPTPSCTFSSHETLSYRATNQTICKPFPYADFPTGFVFSSSTQDLENPSKSTCENMGYGLSLDNHRDNDEFGDIRNYRFPFNLPETGGGGADEWKLNMAWDSPPCPSESTTYSNSVIINGK